MLTILFIRLSVQDWRYSSKLLLENEKGREAVGRIATLGAQGSSPFATPSLLSMGFIQWAG